MVDWNYQVFSPRSSEHEKIKRKIRELYLNNPLISQYNWFRLTVLLKNYYTCLVDAPHPFILIFSKQSKAIELIHPLKQDQEYLSFLIAFMKTHGLNQVSLPKTSFLDNVHSQYFSKTSLTITKYLARDTPRFNNSSQAHVKQLQPSNQELLQDILHYKEQGRDMAESMFQYIMDTPLLDYKSSAFMNTDYFKGYVLTQLDPEIMEGTIEWLYYSSLSKENRRYLSSLISHSLVNLLSQGTKWVALSLRFREAQVLKDLLEQLGFLQKQDHVIVKI